MIDKFCYKFFAGIDDICEWIAKRFNNKKNDKKN